VLPEYIAAAMRHARYEVLPEDAGYYGEIPELPGLWANANTLEACREELREVLEDWIALGLAQGSPIPPIDGLAVTIKQPV
jgi:predicted RNase H-like HicB family nuclease